MQDISLSLEKQRAKSQRKTRPPHVTVFCTDVSLLVGTVHSICCAEQEAGAQGLLGEREANTPEASSIVFLRAVSLATLWLSRLRRSWEQSI